MTDSTDTRSNHGCVVRFSNSSTPYVRVEVPGLGHLVYHPLPDANPNPCLLAQTTQQELDAIASLKPDNFAPGQVESMQLLTETHMNCHQRDALDLITVFTKRAREFLLDELVSL